MSLSPFFKGAIGFVGCASVCAIAYKIGKSVGREETLREVEQEERYIAAVQQVQPAVANESSQQTIIPLNQESAAALTDHQPQTVAERVRKMHGFRGAIFGGTSVIKDLLKNPDGKKLVMTVENGDIVARISQKEG